MLQQMDDSGDMCCVLDSSSRTSFDGIPTRSAISLAAWRAHTDAGCSPAGMIAVCFESRSAESVWHALLADRKLRGARSTAEPNPKPPKLTGRQTCIHDF